MIKNIEVKNFKAIESAKVKLTPLTAFIGYNGVGKSSLLEALQMFKSIVTEGLDTAIRPWREFEHIYYKGKKTHKQYEIEGVKTLFAPMKFGIDLSLPVGKAKLQTSIAQEKEGRRNLFFIEERIRGNSISFIHNTQNKIDEVRKKESQQFSLDFGRGFSGGIYDPDKSMHYYVNSIKNYIDQWQFLSMNTFLMGDPFAQKKTGGAITLHKDGRNIAEYLLSIRDKDLYVFKGILETLQYLLPYAEDLQPQITQELEKMVYLQLSEQDFKLPGWMLSTGTLKILALLAVFRHPEPSPLIVIEELENGLDPRTIHLVITEIRNYIENKKGQVLITSHSPYLLDQLHISQIIFVERKEEKVSLSRPADDEEVLEWSKKFAPGQLYTQKGFSN
jgi:predicted ATPase